MELNYGMLIASAILLVWILGVSCLLIDCLIKPKIILSPTKKVVKKESYYIETPYDTTEASVIFKDDDNPLIISSSIFDDFDNITDSLS